MPVIIERKKGGRVGFEFDANAEFLIGDVSRFTGYDKRTLQRLDGDAIPQSHRDDSGRRVWYAKEIVTIRAHRNKTTKNRGKR